MRGDIKEDRNAFNKYYPGDDAKALFAANSYINAITVALGEDRIYRYRREDYNYCFNELAFAKSLVPDCEHLDEAENLLKKSMKVQGDYFAKKAACRKDKGKRERKCQRVARAKR